MSHDAFIRSVRQTTHGPALETLHRVHVAITRPDGTLVGAAGSPDYTSPMRSCLKPIQAQALLRSGAFERFASTSDELAIACASHEANVVHTDLVKRWLDRLGLSVSSLQCGAHPPADKESVAAMAASGEIPTALHNNCSGKHTGMLAAALALGADPRRYMHAQSPVQLLIRAALEDHLPPAHEPPVWGVDGCSAPTPILSMTQLATLYARLIAASAGQVDDARLGQTALAMMEHPELVGGRGVIDTRLMRSLKNLVAKRGADGVYAMGYLHPEHGPIGIALKVEDGSDLARAPAVLATLAALGALIPATRVALGDLIRPERKNYRGLLVGALVADLAFTFA